MNSLSGSIALYQPATLLMICLAVSLTASLIYVPLVRFLARRIGMVDRPDSDRKLQKDAVALGGGAAVFLGMLTGFVVAILVDREYFSRSLGNVSTHWYHLFGAAAFMLIVGLVDDIWNLRGRQKLLLQCLIITALVGGGTLVEEIRVWGYRLDLGVFAFPLTVLWLLIAVNALNLIDGADGMASTVGCIICFGLGIMGLQQGSYMTALIGFSLGASLVGFLVFNLPPASIYLGDAGSMTVGLIVGTLAIWTNSQESAVLAVAPIAILTVPLIDSGAAILRRWLTGRSIYVTDRAHLHHLLHEKYGSRKMLLLVASLCVITTTHAILSARWNQHWLAVAGVLLVMGILVVTKTFGNAEVRLTLGKAKHFATSLVTLRSTDKNAKHHVKVPLQGVGNWETIWEPLVEFAQTHELAKIKIDLNLAWLEEGYHATWQSVYLPEKAFQANVCLPLITERQDSGKHVPIGQLLIIAAANDPGVYQRLAELSEQVGDLLPQIDQIIARLEEKKRAATAVQTQQSHVNESVPRHSHGLSEANVG